MIVEIPNSWEEIPVGNLGEPIGGIAFRPHDTRDAAQPGLIACFRTSNIQQRLDQRDVLFVPRELVRNERQILQNGDLLISTANSDNLVGKCVIIEKLDYESTLGGFISAFRTDPTLVNPYFFYHWASSPVVQARLRSLARRTTNIANLAMSDFSRLKIHLPPLSEQQRIVDILQEAEEIRRLRIAAEFRTGDMICWMFQSVFGDPLRNPRKWPVAAIGSLINGTPKNGLYKPAELYGEGTPIIRIGDFTGGILRNAKGLQRLRISEEEITQFGVGNGQILINRVNSMEHLGKSLLVDSLTEPTVYESNMMRLDPNLDRILPDYLIACLHHPSTLLKLRAKAKKAINQASINQADVVTLEIPVPPLEAQKTFATHVREVELILSLENEALRTEKLLEESLSAYAFSGRLTADWREANGKMLALEVQKRDKKLKLFRGKTVLVNFSNADPSEDADAFNIPTDLNREQVGLLFNLRAMRIRKELPPYFTSEFLAELINGPLHRHPQAIESHLSVFAARGLVIPVSRRRNDANGNPFAGCYRLSHKSIKGMSFSGEENIALPKQPGDDVRGELMEIQRRLATGAI